MRKSRARQTQTGTYFTGQQPAVDVAFARHRDGIPNPRLVRFCFSCGRRHREGYECAMDLAGGDPERNGPYRGTLTVRELPAGVTGADLARQRSRSRQGRRPVAIGQLWRGPTGDAYRVAKVDRQRVTLTPTTGPHQVKVTRRSMVRTRGWECLAEGR